MIVFKQESIEFATEDIIAHGCNCSNGFGSGIAGVISRMFPEAKKQFHLKNDEFGWKLFDIQYVDCGSKIIANCATQKNYGSYLSMSNFSIQERYDAIEIVLMKLYQYSRDTGKSVAIPKIGCGLARGDWRIVKSLISKIFYDRNITVYYL